MAAASRPVNESCVLGRPQRHLQQVDRPAGAIVRTGGALAAASGATCARSEANSENIEPAASLESFKWADEMNSTDGNQSISPFVRHLAAAAAAAAEQ